MFDVERTFRRIVHLTLLETLMFYFLLGIPAPKTITSNTEPCFLYINFVLSNI